MRIWTFFFFLIFYGRPTFLIFILQREVDAEEHDKD